MPAALAVPALIGAGGQIAGSLIQGHTAKKVGQQQADAAAKAAALQQNAANQSLGQQGSLLNAAQGGYQPYLNLGTQAAGLLSGSMGQAPANFTATTGADLANDPGYQFRMAEDQKNAQRTAAARGTLLTGGTLKALQDRGQQMASNEFGNVDARRFRDYQSGLANQQQQFGNQFSLLNFGAGQNQNLNNLTQGYADMMNRTRMFGAGAGANGITDTANALAAGQIGASNAYGGAINGIQQLLALLARQPGNQSNNNPAGSAPAPSTPLPWWQGGPMVPGQTGGLLPPR